MEEILHGAYKGSGNAEDLIRRVSLVVVFVKSPSISPK
jgi:hypothetical protein